MEQLGSNKPELSTQNLKFILSLQVSYLGSGGWLFGNRLSGQKNSAYKVCCLSYKLPYKQKGNNSIINRQPESVGENFTKFHTCIEGELACSLMTPLIGFLIEVISTETIYTQISKIHSVGSIMLLVYVYVCNHNNCKH